MKIATSELEHLREEVKNCHRIIKDLQKKREFVGLTDKEKHEIRYSHMTSAEFIDFIEAKLKDKNTSEQEWR